MALLVFLTFLSVIVNQYVPVWMKDTEASHMNAAFGQLASMKSGLDLQILAAMAAQQSGTFYVPVTLFTPVTLGVDGVPIFSGPTIGELRLVQDGAPWTLEFVYIVNGVQTRATDRAAGKIVLDVHNRYFVPQTLAYESGGVIRAQTGGQAIRAAPTFEVGAINGSVTVGLTLVSLFGSGGASGTTTDGVSAKLLGVDSQSYRSLQSPVWINHTTDYGPAWYGLFNDTLARAFGITPSRLSPCPSMYCFTGAYSGGQATLLRASTPFYDLRSTWSITARTYSVTLTLMNDWQNIDPVAFAITGLIVQHAFVNAAVGAATNEVV